MAFARIKLQKGLALLLMFAIVTGSLVSKSSYALAFTNHARVNKIRQSLSMSIVATYNHLMRMQSLRNEYVALRHGQSLANVANIIASSPDIATTNYGLSDVGREQAELAAHDVVNLVRSHQPKYQGVLILSSDLLRAKETAEAVARALTAHVPNVPLVQQCVVIDVRLRERWFGNWDGGSDDHYHDVWKEDALDPSHQKEGVEAVTSVMQRATHCVVDWDAQVTNCLILCVAHGDVLQILQTAFVKMDGSLHRTLDHLDTAKLRRLVLQPDPM